MFALPRQAVCRLVNRPLQVNPSHRLGVGHVLTVLANQSLAPQPIGRYRTPLTPAGTAGNAISKLGPAMAFPASGDNYAIPAVNSLDVVGGARVTYAFVRQKTSTAINLSPSFGIIAPTANANRAGGHAPFSDGTVYWDFGGQAGANRITWTGYTAGTEVEYWVFVAGARGSAIYYQGLLRSSQGTGITRTAENKTVGINLGNGNVVSNPNNIISFAIFNAEWTPGQVREWTANPVCYLANYAQPRWGKAAAAAGGFFSRYYYDQISGGMAA